MINADQENGTDYLGSIVKKYNDALLHQKTITCDLDLNPNKMFKSNMVHDIGIGALKGSGFRVRSKPNAWSATCAADLLCK